MALSRIRAQHTGTSVAMEEISMEEEALLIQESAGDLAEAEAEIEDAQEDRLVQAQPGYGHRLETAPMLLVWSLLSLLRVN